MFFSMHPQRRQRQLSALVDDYVIRCRFEVVERVRGKARAMSAAEARGYARAHARVVVEGRLDLARRVRPAGERLADPLVVERIVEGITAHVDRELARQRASLTAPRRMAA